MSALLVEFFHNVSHNFVQAAAAVFLYGGF